MELISSVAYYIFASKLSGECSAKSAYWQRQPVNHLRICKVDMEKTGFFDTASYPPVNLIPAQLVAQIRFRFIARPVLVSERDVRVARF